MNKKLIASLLTLGLVLSPGLGTLNESFATEASDNQKNLEQTSDPLVLLKAYVGEFEATKKTEAYRLASGEVCAKIDKLINESKALISETDPDRSKASGYIKDIDAANGELVESAKANVKALKTSIILGEKFIESQKDVAAEKDAKKLYDKLADDIASKKKILYPKELETYIGDEIKTRTDDLDKLYKEVKDAYNGPKDYEVIEADYIKLDEEIKEASRDITEKDKTDLSAEVEAIKEDYPKFIEESKFNNTSEENKKAYKDAYDVLKQLSNQGVKNENYWVIKNALKTLVDARKKIDATTPDLNTGKEAEKDGTDQMMEAIKKLDAHVKEKDEVLKNLKDKSLAKSYEEKIALAQTYCTNYAKGIRRDYDAYKNLVKEIEELKEKIKSSKAGESAIEKYRIEDLENYKKIAENLRNKDYYKNASSKNQIKLDEAINDADKLIKLYKASPNLINSEEITKAKDAILDAFKALNYNINDFDDKAKAKEAMKKLLESTKALKLDQIYGKDQKEAKEAYIKARDMAAKLVKDDSKASLEDMNKAYKDFSDNVNKLAEFLTSRLQKLVDDNKNFKESTKYKEADKKSEMKPAILNYLTIIADSEKELAKAVPDANVLDKLYKKLVVARSEINGDMPSWARKLSYDILDFDDFKNSPSFVTAANGLKGNLSKATDLYGQYIKMAERLKEADKLGSDEAKDLSDLIDHTRRFIEGDIKENEYLANKYYHTLKAIKNHKDYKTINQATRIRLEKAMKLYEENGYNEEVYRTLGEVMNDEAVKKFSTKIQIENNPNYTRDKLLTDLNELINGDKELKEGGFKHQKAQKALRDAYDLALQEAKDFIANNDKPTEAEVRAVYNKLLDAKNKLDGDKFEKLTFDLAARFKKEQLKIANAADRKAIADKINSLSDPSATMDDALRVEKELNDLINPKVITTTTLAPKGGLPTTTRPVPTVTNPGSIVKTGIKGIGKVAAVLAVACGILLFTKKKGDKNENN